MLIFLYSFLIIFSASDNLLAASLPPDEHIITSSNNSNGETFTEDILIWYNSKPHDFENYQKVVGKIGWVYTPNATTSRSVRSKTSGYEFTFHTNEYGLRLLPPLPKTKNQKHLIVAGESNTFGQGVSDKKNTPYLLQLEHPNYHAYNFSQCGAGPHNTLALLEFFPWEKNIEESEGKMIYIYYPQWMNERVIGTKDYISWDQGKAPWYELNNRDEVVYKGAFKDRWLTRIFQFITLVDRYHWVGNIPKFNDDHQKLIAKIFVKMKSEYLKKFPKGEFIVLVSSYVSSNQAQDEKLVNMLKADHVNAINIHKNTVQNRSHHFMDYHFNEKGQQMVADTISETIQF